MSAAARYALIGATGIGGYHLAALQKMESAGLVRLSAVADPALAKSAELRSELAARGVETYLDYQEMLSGQHDLQVVVISAPIPLHLEMTLACLERDLFIYLEKPPVPLIQQLEVLLSHPGQHRVGVGFQMVNASWAQEIKSAIMAGRLGTPQEIRVGACWPRLDRYYSRNDAAGKMSVRGEPVFDGPATNALAHLIHNAMFFAGAAPREFGIPDEITASLYRSREIESYDVACLQARFSSGLTLTAALTHATERPLPYVVEVQGSAGRARVSGDGASFASDCFSFSPPQESFEQLLEKTHGQFLEFVCGRQPAPATTLEDTRGYLLATNGMLLSSGGVHDIDPSHVHRYRRDDDEGRDVAGLYEAVHASLETGKLFADLGVPWAVKTQPVSVTNLKTLNFPGLAAGSV